MEKDIIRTSNDLSDTDDAAKDENLVKLYNKISKIDRLLEIKLRDIEIFMEQTNIKLSETKTELVDTKLEIANTVKSELKKYSNEFENELISSKNEIKNIKTNLEGKLKNEMRYYSRHQNLGDVENSPSTSTQITSRVSAKTEPVLCFDGRLFYEALCMQESNTGNEMKYYVHYVAWDNKWDEWVSESRLLNITANNIKPHVNVFGFKSLVDSLICRFPEINAKQESKEDIKKFAIGERVLCFDGKLFLEGICRETRIVDNKLTYLIHYFGLGKLLDEWVAENRLLKRNEKNMHSHRGLIARLIACDDYE